MPRSPIFLGLLLCSCWRSNGIEVYPTDQGEDSESTVFEEDNNIDILDSSNDALDDGSIHDLDQDSDIEAVQDPPPVPCQGNYDWQGLNVSDIGPFPEKYRRYGIFPVTWDDFYPVIFFARDNWDEDTPFSMALTLLDYNFQAIGPPQDVEELGNDNMDAWAYALDNRILLYLKKYPLPGHWVFTVVEYDERGEILFMGMQPVNETAGSLPPAVWTGSEYQVVWTDIEGGNNINHVTRYNSRIEIIADATAAPLYTRPYPAWIASYEYFLYWVGDHYLRIDYVIATEPGFSAAYASSWDAEHGQLDEMVRIDLLGPEVIWTVPMFYLWTGEEYIVLYAYVFPDVDTFHGRVEIVRWDDNYGRIGDPIVVIDRPLIVTRLEYVWGDIAWNGSEFMAYISTGWSECMACTPQDYRYYRFDENFNLLQEWSFLCEEGPAICFSDFGASLSFKTIEWTGNGFVTDRPCPGGLRKKCLDYLVCTQ